NIRCAISHNSHALLYVSIPAAYGSRHHAHRPCTPASCRRSPAVCCGLSWHLPLERTPGRKPSSAAIRCACASLATTAGRCCLCRDHCIGPLWIWVRKSSISLLCWRRLCHRGSPVTRHGLQDTDLTRLLPCYSSPGLPMRPRRYYLNVCQETMTMPCMHSYS